MGSEAKKTEHSGAKKRLRGLPGEEGRSQKDSNKKRRENNKVSVKETVK